MATGGRPKGLRNWPTSARVTVGVLVLTTLIGLGAAAEPAPETVEAGSTRTTEAPTTTEPPTTTSSSLPPTTAAPATTTTPPTTAAPTTTTPTAAPPPTTAAPAPAPAVPQTAPPAPAPAPAVYYENCDAARAAGAAPVHRGDPGYGPHLDRDDDGTGCE